MVARVGDQTVAVEVALVSEAMRPLPIRAGDALPSFVLGGAVIRGQELPVVDLHALLGGGADPSLDHRRFVVVHAGQGSVALQVDAVLGVRRLPRRDLRRLPCVFDRADASTAEGLGRVDGLASVMRELRLLPDPAWAASGPPPAGRP